MSRAQRNIHRQVASFLRYLGVSRDRPVLVAVSGGADSTALLAVLCALGQRVGVAHVHHGLRGLEADGDAGFVGQRARAAGLRFHLVRLEGVRAGQGSPEARARHLRYETLRHIAGSEGYAHVATAHTLDDQAETLLLRAARGTGLRGLRGIAPVSDDGVVVRPLLAVRRSDLRRYLNEQRFCWREDSSNRDLGVPRNRLRAEALPVFESVHSGATERIAMLAERARELDRWLLDQSRDVLDSAIEAGDGGLWIERAALRALPELVRAPALARLLERVGLGQRVTRRHLARMTRFAEVAAPRKQLSLPMDHALFADRHALWVGPLPGPSFPAAFDRTLEQGVPLDLPERGLRLVWTARTRDGDSALWIPRELTSVRVRTPLPEDRLRTHEEGSPRPLSEVFSRGRWSQRQKAYAVVVAQGAEALGALAPSNSVGGDEQQGAAPEVARGAASIAPKPGRKDGWGLRVECLSHRLGSC